MSFVVWKRLSGAQLFRSHQVGGLLFASMLIGPLIAPPVGGFLGTRLDPGMGRFHEIPCLWCGCTKTRIDHHSAWPSWGIFKGWFRGMPISVSPPFSLASGAGDHKVAWYRSMYPEMASFDVEDMFLSGMLGLSAWLRVDANRASKPLFGWAVSIMVQAGKLLLRASNNDKQWILPQIGSGEHPCSNYHGLLSELYMDIEHRHVHNI